MNPSNPTTTTARPDDRVQIDHGEVRRRARLGEASAAERRRGLVQLFLGESMRGLGRKLLLLLPWVPAFAVMAESLIGLQVNIEGLRVPAEGRAAFALKCMTHEMFAAMAWSALAAATAIAGVVPADLKAGALLLYFTRPVRRRDYLIARHLAGALFLLAGALPPAIAVLFVLAAQVGVSPGGVAGAAAWLFWPGLLLAVTLAAATMAAALAIVAVALGGWVRSGGGAGVLLLGTGLGSMVVARALVELAGRDSLAGALNLPAALVAPFALLIRPWESAPAPAIATLEAAAGIGLWLAIVAASWALAGRMLATAPMGRGRT